MTAVEALELADRHDPRGVTVSPLSDTGTTRQEEQQR